LPRAEDEPPQEFQEQESSEPMRYLRHQFNLLFLPIALLVLVGAWFYGRAAVDREIGRLQTQESLNVGLGSAALKGRLEDIARDLAYLATSGSVRAALEPGNAKAIAALENNLFHFSASKRIYDQVRWIDETGMERVRVDYRDGKAVVIPRVQLQPKGQRYFFTDTIKLNPGEIFVSPLDLNIEQNKVEVPHKPMLRVATPVADGQGNKRGIVILNYLGRLLLDDFVAYSGAIADHAMLLNDEGYWLRSPLPEDEWGFMLKHTALSLAARTPEAWKHIHGQDAGQVELADGLWTWQTVYPLVEGQRSSSGSDEAFQPSRSDVDAKRYFWKVAAHLPAAKLTGVRWAVWQPLAVVVALLLTGIALASWRVAQDWSARREAEEEVRRINAGLSEIVAERTQELEQHRHRLEDLVAERTAELEQARDRSEAASRAKTAFLANMSHEIRTPLNGVLGMAHLLRRSQLTDKQKDQVSKILIAGQHLLEILNDVLDLAKIEAGKLPVVEVPVSVDAVLQNVVSMMQSRIDEKGLQLAIEAERPLPILLGDNGRLQQALLNYVANAVKFTERGRVIVRAKRAAEDSETVTLRFEVEDTGIGIASEDLKRLFTAFEQADNSETRKYGGTGLGLVIVRKLAHLMGGEAGAESTPGMGSTFWFDACLRKASASGLESGVSVPEDVEKLLRLGYSGRLVLLAEDDPTNREVTLALLEEVGLTADTAEDGAEALRLARDNDYAVILMDLRMPKLDGLEATRQIRLLPRHGATPILAITANTFMRDRQRCIDAGMNDFIPKPVTPEHLFAALLRWMGGHADAFEAAHSRGGPAE
jgi:signal transduction histidine kinase/CheY-like chemotaxis protein